jgi:D-lactate dehydrogenase (cytochrome)
VGLRKVPHQAAEHGEALALMQDVKAAFDPLGILSPGKVLPDRGA